MQGRSKTRGAVAILLQRPCSCPTDRAASCARDAHAYSEQNYVSTNTGYSYAKTDYLFCTTGFKLQFPKILWVSLPNFRTIETKRAEQDANF